MDSFTLNLQELKYYQQISEVCKVCRCISPELISLQ